MTHYVLCSLGGSRFALAFLVALLPRALRFALAFLVALLPRASRFALARISHTRKFKKKKVCLHQLKMVFFFFFCVRSAVLNPHSTCGQELNCAT